MVTALHDRRVVALLDTLSKNLNTEDRALLTRLVALSGDDPEGLLHLLKDLSVAEFKWTPVDTETFLLGREYLNLKGQLFPQLVDDLVTLFEDPIGYEEFTGCGGIGWGKSTISECILARMVYEVSCLRNPQHSFGLMDGATITLLNASVNLKSAEKVVFGGLKTKLSVSPYFIEQFPLDEDKKKELWFPNHLLIMPAAGSEQGTVGFNVIGGVLDEVNFWQVVEASSLNRGLRYDQARHVYDLLKRRIKSRFNRAGKLPGKFVQVSSSKYPDDFTETRIAEIRAEEARHRDNPEEFAHPKALFRRYSTWSTKPREQFLPESFWLYLGTTADQPGISKDRADYADKDPERVIEVPMDFWNDFATDLNGSIRDLAGFPTLAVKPFFPQKDKIVAAMERGRAAGMVHPFTAVETTLADGAFFDPRLLKLDPNRPAYAHIDLAISKDAAGVAIAWQDGWRKITKTSKVTGDQVTTMEPLIAVPLMLRVTAPPGGEIQPGEIRALLMELRHLGLNLRKVTYDQYQSAESIQAFERMNIESERFSVDQPMDAYQNLQEAVLEDRLMTYGYAPLLEELVRLEIKENGTKTKVDHPPKGSKDVADAVCGAVWHVTQAKQYVVVDPTYGEAATATPTQPGDRRNNPAAGLMPVRDDAGELLPGKKPRSLEDVMWRGAPGHDDEDDDDGSYASGFA